MRSPPTSASDISDITATAWSGRYKEVEKRLVASIETFLTASEQNLLRGKLWIVEPGRIREHRIDDEEHDADPA